MRSGAKRVGGDKGQAGPRAQPEDRAGRLVCEYSLLALIEPRGQTANTNKQEYEKER